MRRQNFKDLRLFEKVWYYYCAIMMNVFFALGSGMIGKHLIDNHIIDPSLAILFLTLHAGAVIVGLGCLADKVGGQRS